MDIIFDNQRDLFLEFISLLRTEWIWAGVEFPEELKNELDWLMTVSAFTCASMSRFLASSWFWSYLSYDIQVRFIRTTLGAYEVASLLAKVNLFTVFPRGELQVSTGASAAGYPGSPGLPLRHLSAAGRGGTHLCSLHPLLPVCCCATGKLMQLLYIHTLCEMFPWRVFATRNKIEVIFIFLLMVVNSEWFLMNSLALTFQVTLWYKLWKPAIRG